MRHFRLLLMPCLLGACGTASVNREYEGAYPVFEDDCPVIWMNAQGRAVCPDPLAEFIFPDLNTGWLMKLTMEGTVEFCEEKIDENFADGIIEFDSDILVGIMNKSINPQEVKADGRMKLRKSLDALGKIMLPATS